MLTEIRGTRRFSRIASLILVPVLALIALLAWGLSSPAGSSPDEDFHLASIWCGHGVDGTNCRSATSDSKRTVARDLVVDSRCFALHREQSATCQGEDFGTKPNDTVQTGRGNFEGLYPPVFYFVMSGFAGADIGNSVLAMRLFASLLFVALVSLLFALLPLHRRQTLLWSLVVSLVPLGMFLIPSVNPSGWAVLSAATLWLAVLGFFESAGWRRVGLGAIAVVATVVGAGSRADAAVYAGFAIAMSLLLSFRKDRRWMIDAILPVILLIAAVVFFLSAGQGSAASGGLAPERTDSGVSALSLAISNVQEVPSLWVGVFGYWGLGWLDTTMPSGVWVAGLVSFVGAIFIGLGTKVPRKAIAVVATAIALLAVPTILLVESRTYVGNDVQPRYLVPLIVILAGFALLQSQNTRLRVTALHRWLVITALASANSLALQTNIRRYVTGGDVGGFNLDSRAEWWWNVPVSPMMTWIVGSLAFAGVIVIASTRVFNLPAGFETFEAEDDALRYSPTG